MGSDGQQVKMALLHWVNTFDIEGSPHTIRCFEELSDGIIVYKILLEIDPAFFRSAMGATPVENGLSNWVLRLNNVKRIYKFLERYYEEKQNQSLADTDRDIPNLEAIAKNSSEGELVKLLKIVLRCSFFGDNREKSMKRMKNLDSQVQAVLEQVNSEVIGLKRKDGLDRKIEKKTLSFDEEIAIVSKEKDILKKNYELILEENVILRENQKTMKSKLSSINEELNKAENLIADYESQISHLQMQVGQFEYELHQYKDACLQKDLEIERQNEIIISLTHQKEELKTEKHVLLRSELQREKQSLEEDKSLVSMYEQKLEEDLDILSQDEVLSLENISYRKNNKKYVSIDSENIVKDDILESRSHKTPCNKLIKETSELKAEYLKNEIHSFYEKINASQPKEDFDDYSEKSFKDLDHELKRQSNPYSHSETSQFQQESDMLKKKPSEKSIVVIKNLINNLKKSKDKTEDKHFEKEEKKNELDHQIHNNNNNNNNIFLKDLKLSSSSIPFKTDTIPEIQIQELENLNILKENSHVIKQKIDKENICDLVLTHESNESRKLQVELRKLKKSIEDLEDENHHQMNIINELNKEKDTLMNELIINKDLLSNQQQENDKLNSIITSISVTIDQERKKQLEAQEKIEKLQDELDQRITGALKAKQLLKKQDSIIKEYKEKMALCKSTDELYNELMLKNKEIEKLKKINEETAKLKEENARMIDAWHNLTSHMQQKNPTIQHTFIESPSSLD